MDFYYSVQKESTGEYKEKGSKFLAFVFPMDDEKMLGDYLSIVKGEHPKARHFCYAYRLKMNGEIFRINDDGEPSGTAGKPILGQIISFGLSDVLVIVVRYFGGTKLGVSGLIQAYKSATEDGLVLAGKKTKYVYKKYFLSFSASDMGHVFHVIKSNGVEIADSLFGEVNKISFLIRLSSEESLLTQIKAGLLKMTYEQALNTIDWGDYTLEGSETIIQ